MREKHVEGFCMKSSSIQLLRSIAVVTALVGLFLVTPSVQSLGLGARAARGVDGLGPVGDAALTMHVVDDAVAGLTRD